LHILLNIWSRLDLGKNVSVFGVPSRDILGAELMVLKVGGLFFQKLPAAFFLRSLYVVPLPLGEYLGHMGLQLFYQIFGSALGVGLRELTDQLGLLLRCWPSVELGMFDTRLIEAVSILIPPFLQLFLIDLAPLPLSLNFLRLQKCGLCPSRVRIFTETSQTVAPAA